VHSRLLGIGFGRQAKKLIGAARFWAGERPEAFEIDDTVLEALAKAGAPADVLEAAEANVVPVAYEVWEDNMESLHLFLAMRTQWRWLGTMGGAVRTGLDYTAVIHTLRELVQKKARRREIFQDICLMGDEALAVFNEQSQRDRG
jgi:hypothetical protein